MPRSRSTASLGHWAEGNKALSPRAQGSVERQNPRLTWKKETEVHSFIASMWRAGPPPDVTAHRLIVVRMCLSVMPFHGTSVSLAC